MIAYLCDKSNPSITEFPLKFLLKIIFVVAAFYMLHVDAVAQNSLQRLPVEVETLRGDLLKSNIWDFSKQWQITDQGRTTICNYGDTLLAETIDSRRNWYALCGDTIKYIGEEDRLTTITLDTAIVAGYRESTSKSFAIKSQYTATGKGGGRRFTIKERGTIDYATAGHYGTLILTAGDTLHNVTLTRERRSFSASFPDDNQDVAISAMIETYRWHDEEATTYVPLAIQQSIFAATKERYLAKDTKASFAVAFLPYKEEDEIKEVKGKIKDNQAEYDLVAIADALSRATMEYDGRMIATTVTLPYEEMMVTLDIVDSAGHLYLYSTKVSTGGNDTITVDCGCLHPGEYLSILGVENIGVAPEKKIVIIR